MNNINLEDQRICV